MRSKTGARLRNKLRTVAAFATFIVLFLLLTELWDQRYEDREKSAAVGFGSAFVVFLFITTFEENDGPFGAVCRAITRPFRHEPRNNP